MVNLEIDDKNLKKERQKMEKEEQRLKNEQEKALKQQRKAKAPKENNQSQTKFKKYKDNKILLKKVLIGIIVLAVVSSIFLLKNTINDYVETVKSDNGMQADERVMVNIIGFDIDSAKKELKNNEINFTIVPIVDNYNIPGNVVKCDREVGEYININDTIKVYVCDNGILETDIDHKVDTEETPFTKNNIDVLGFSTTGNDFNIIIQNNNEVVIDSIAYTITYIDKNGNKIGDKTFKEFDIIIQPGEKYVLTNSIKNNDAYSLKINKFFCTIKSGEE